MTDPDTTALAVEARGLLKSCRRPAGRRRDRLRRDAGSACFLGPNGAGKTTTIHMIACFVRVDAGQLLVLARACAVAGPEIKRRLGVLPQEDSLDPDLTVRQNLTVYARYFDVAAAKARERADELLRFVQLDERAADPIRVLSGGMRRRLMLARALISRPALFILDEPTTGLDPQARHLVWQKLRGLASRGRDDAAHHPLHGGGDPALRPRFRAGPAGVSSPGDAGGVHRRARGPRGDRGPRRRAGSPAICSRACCASDHRVARRRASTSPRRPPSAKARYEHAYAPSAMSRRSRGSPAASSASRASMKGAWSVWRRNFDSWRRYYRGLLVGTVLDPILYFVALGYGLGSFVRPIQGEPYLAFIALVIRRGDEHGRLREHDRLLRAHGRAEDVQPILMTPVSSASSRSESVLWEQPSRSCSAPSSSR